MLSLDTLWDLLKSGNILPDSFNGELERQRIEDQAGASLDALLALSRRERDGAAGAGGAEEDAAYGRGGVLTSLTAWPAGSTARRRRTSNPGRARAPARIERERAGRGGRAAHVVR